MGDFLRLNLDELLPFGRRNFGLVGSFDLQGAEFFDTHVSGVLLNVFRSTTDPPRTRLS